SADDLPVLAQEMAFRGETAGSVRDHRRVIARGRGLHRVEDDRGWVAFGLPGHDRNVDALSPSLELFDGRRAERVRRGEKRTFARILETLRELRRGRRPAAAVDPDDQEHTRFLAARVPREVAGERADQRVAYGVQRPGDGLGGAGTI